MDARRAFGVIVLLVGLLAVVGGLIYLNVPAGSLPSFVPGHLAGVAAKHSTRGAAGILLGIVLVILGGAIVRRGRSSPYPR